MPLDKNDIGIIQEVVKDTMRAEKKKEQVSLSELDQIFRMSPMTASIKDYHQLIQRLIGKAKQEEDLIEDDLFNIWYNEYVVRHVMNDDSYEMIKAFYLVPLIFGPVEQFFASRKNKMKEDRASALNIMIGKDGYGTRLRSINQKYPDYLISNHGQETGTPGSTKEEAEHYENKRQKDNYANEELIGKLRFAYNHAVKDELRADGMDMYAEATG